LVALDTVATNAHGYLLFGGFGVALDFLAMCGDGGHRSDSQGKEGGQQLVHFAHTIQTIDKKHLQIISGSPP
jgi:hypothetical protein